MGISAALRPAMNQRADVYVDERDLHVARQVIADELSVIHAKHDAPPGSAKLIAPKAWFGRGAVAVLAVMAACVGVFFATLRGADAGTRSALLALGAIDSTHVADGEYWRLLSAVFLHFDAHHLLSNLGVLAVVGPPLAHQIGARRFLLVFLASGVGGNIASHLLMPTVALKGGASGAITGVLGALGGLSLRPERRQRRKAWQTLGALAAMYGFLVGFDVTSDNVAHLAGLCSGILLGAVIGELSAPSHPVAGETREPPRVANS
jgi:rhomboid protease GluP